MRPCRYCGFVADRQSDEDCPAKPRSVEDLDDPLDKVAWEVAEQSAKEVRIVLAIWLLAWIMYWILAK